MLRRRFSRWDMALLLLVVAAALAVRVVWVRKADSEAAQAQWEDPRVDAFARHVAREGSFGGPVPLETGGTSGRSASLSPGYVYFLSLFYWGIDRAFESRDAAWREDQVRLAVAMVQAGLGALTAGFIFLIAYRVFDSRIVALLAGLLTAGHYFWIIGTSQVADGVLCSFLVAGSLYFALRTAESAGLSSAALLGGFLGASALTRASLLLFAVVVLVWVVGRLHELPSASLATLVALATLTATLLPWSWRNYRLYHSIVPITSRGGVDLWLGNHSEATGGPLLRRPSGQLELVSSDLVGTDVREPDKLAAMPEPKRFNTLAMHTLAWSDGWVWEHPWQFTKLRGAAIFYFLTGQRMWVGDDDVALVRAAGTTEGALALASDENQDAGASLPSVASAWSVSSNAKASLPPRDRLGTWVLGIMGLGFVFGVQWSRRWPERQGVLLCGLAAAALPWIVSHAGLLHGPRLPVDGIILVYCAFAVAALIPGWYRWLLVTSGFRSGLARR